MSLPIPITLSIIPNVSYIPTNSIQPLNVTTHSTFNHIPITPSLIPRPPQTSAQERENIKAQQNRDRQYRYNERMKPFKRLATIDNDYERIAALISLTCPRLSTLPRISKIFPVKRTKFSLSTYVLHHEVDLFIQSLHAKHASDL
jgi:hypothetical protein